MNSCGSVDFLHFLSLGSLWKGNNLLSRSCHILFWLKSDERREKSGCQEQPVSSVCLFFVALILSFCCSLEHRRGRAPANAGRSSCGVFPLPSAAHCPAPIPDFCLLQCFTLTSPQCWLLTTPDSINDV